MNEEAINVRPIQRFVPGMPDRSLTADVSGGCNANGSTVHATPIPARSPPSTR